MHNRTPIVLAMVTISLSLVVIPGATPSGADIASLYPGDVGIESHPDVVFVEKFDDSLSNVFSRWNEINDGSLMTLDTDVPAGSPAGSRSLYIPGTNSGGHLFKLFSPGYDDTLYVRYYVKYPSSTSYSHNGIWLGGYNPPMPWPNPRAGTCLRGNERISAGAESYSTANHRFDHYNYWKDQRADPNGNCWGNDLLNNSTVVIVPNQWTCVEHMVKLNNPASSKNGEHAIWLNGTKISHLGENFPKGYWIWDSFIQDSIVSTSFEGFQWRTDPALNLNWIWLQNYTPNDPSATLKFDHVVVAKSYIGCLTSRTPADSTPPAPPSNLTVR